MGKLVFRAIETHTEIELFLEKFSQYVGVRLPFDYAERCQIVGAFLHQRMVGGYMLATEPEFRSLMFVPDAIRKSTRISKIGPYQMMEVNGLWISQSLREPKLQLSIWFRLVRDIFLCRKHYVLLMRDSRNRAMERLLNLANPEFVYHGPPRLMAGQESHKNIAVGFVTRWQIVLSSYKYWLELRNRNIRLERFKTRREGITPFKHPEAKAIEVTE